MVDVAKKKQTFTNRVKLRVVDKIREAQANYADLVSQITDPANSDVFDSFTAGEKTALQTLATGINTLNGSSILTAIENRYEPSHRGEAMPEPGA